MSNSSIARDIINQKINDVGTTVLVQNVTESLNTRGDATLTVSGSQFVRAIISYLSREEFAEIQNLPEGKRHDNMATFLLNSLSGNVALNDQILISGTTMTFQVERVSNIRQMGDTVPLLKARAFMV